MMRLAILLTALLTTMALSFAAQAQNGLEVVWYGSVEQVSSERVIVKNAEGRFSLSKKLIQEVRGRPARVGETFELRMPLSQYLSRVEKNRALYLVKEVGRMPASASPAIEEKKQ